MGVVILHVTKKLLKCILGIRCIFMIKKFFLLIFYFISKNVNTKVYQAQKIKFFLLYTLILNKKQKAIFCCCSHYAYNILARTAAFFITSVKEKKHYSPIPHLHSTKLTKYNKDVVSF